jgi:hypothetical protein
MLRLANAFNHDTWSHIQSSLHGRLALGKGRVVQDFAFISQKEQMIASRRHDFVNSITESDAADYMLLTRLLSKCLRYHPRFKVDGTSVMSTVNNHWVTKKKPPTCDWPGKIDGKYYWFADSQIDVICPMASWMLWFILHVGPDPFFRQWTSHYDEEDSEADHVSKLAWSLWEGQDARTTKKRAQLASELDVAIRRKCLRPGRGKSYKGQQGDQLLNDAIQRGTTDHNLFVKEALCPEYFMQWRAMGGENFQVDLSEEEKAVDEEMIGMGRHPREKVPFFVYLGREPSRDRADEG